MNALLAFVAAAFIIAGCNNSTDKSPVAADTIQHAASSTTNEGIQPFLPALTADEMADDSVFDDQSRPTSWTNAGIDDPVAFKKFLKKLQGWVAAAQKDSVAAAIIFPLRNPKVKDRTAFLAGYDTWFNDKVKAALKNQNFRQIFRNDQGAMIGTGQLWLRQFPGGFAITAINSQ